MMHIHLFPNQVRQQRVRLQGLRTGTGCGCPTGGIISGEFAFSSIDWAIQQCQLQRIQISHHSHVECKGEGS